MDSPSPSEDLLTLVEVMEQCQVTAELVADWIQEKGLPVYDVDDKLMVKYSELLKFLYQYKEYELLSRLPYLDETEKEVFYHMDKAKRAEKAQLAEKIYRKFEEMHSEIKAKCEECIVKIRSLEEQCALPSPEIDSVKLTSIEELCKKYATLNCEAISSLCGVDTKTISRWRKKGLEMYMKDGQLETSLQNLIHFLGLDEKKTKYLERIVAVNFKDIVESLEKRYTIVHKHVKAEKQKPKKIEQEICRNISAILNPLKIDEIGRDKMPAKEGIERKAKTPKEVQAIEHISRIVERATGLTPDDVEIGKRLIKKLNVINEDGIKDIEQKKEEYGYQLVNLVFKLWMDIESKANPSLADKIKAAYVKLIQERGLEPIEMNLSDTGLTPKFILDELASTKPVPMRDIFLHFIPKDRISPALCFRTYILLQYVDNKQGSWLLQEMFEYNRISIADAELYAVCWFLNKNIWSTEDISRENRVIGIGALMGVGTDAVYKRLRIIKSLKNNFSKLVQNMLNPAYGNMFESSTKKENENLPDEEKGSLDYSERENTSDKGSLSEVEEEKDDIIEILYKPLERKQISIEDARSYLKTEFERIKDSVRKKGLVKGVEYIIANTQDENTRKGLAQELRKISIPYSSNTSE